MKIKVSIISAAATLVMAMPSIGHAQVPVTAAASVLAGTSSQAGIINIVGGAAGGGGGGGGGGGVGGLANPQFIVGQSTIGPTVPTVDRCKHVRSGSLPFGIGAGWTTADEDCKAEEQATWLWRAGQQNAAIERYCDIEGARNAMARSAGYQCVATVEARRVAEEKANRNRPAPVAVAPVQTVSALPPGCRMVQPGNYMTCQ